MSILKKAFVILGGLLLLGLFSFPAMGEAGGLELNYPKIPGIATTPTSESSLAQYLAYLYYLVVDIVGVVAFVVLIVGGIQYLTSAGSVSKATAARKRIIGGGAGLLIVLGAFMILRTVNPQLVGLEPVKMIPLHGVCLYAQRGTEDEKMYCLDENTAEILPKDFHAKEIEIEGPQSEFRTVFLFTEKNYQGEIAALTNPLIVRPDAGEKRPKYNLSQSPHSIYFDDYSYGIYLFPHEGGGYTEETFQDFPKNLPLVLTGPRTDLDNFNDRAQSLYLLNTYEEWTHSVAENLAEGPSISGYDPNYDPFSNPLIDPFSGDYDWCYNDLDIEASFVNPFFEPDDYCSISQVPSIDELSTMFSSPFHNDYNWGAILHTNTDGEGECGIVYPPQGTYNKVVASLNEIDLHPITQVRSVDVFNLHQHPEDLRGSVTFCEKPNGVGPCVVAYLPDGDTIWHQTFDKYPWNGLETILSVNIEGSFWVVMTNDLDFGGNCETFTASNADLKGEYVLQARTYDNEKIYSIAVIPIVPSGEL